MPDPIGNEPRTWQEDYILTTWFSYKMVGKMQKNAHKAHWNTVSQEWLFERLQDEVLELLKALRTNGDVVSECTDVANFAAMIADNHKNGVKNDVFTN